jgi:hypothetical protein
MAGRKHHLQQYGYAGKDLGGIKDPIERDLAFKSISLTPYCKHCGKEIMMMAQEEASPKKYQAEVKAHAHTVCQNKWEEEYKAKVAAEQQAAAKAFAELDMDAYMEQLMKEREK